MTDEDLNMYKPVQGIIVYKDSNNYYLETHDILESKGNFHWQEGKPLVKSDLKEIATSIGEQTFTPLTIDGIIPESVLYLKQNYSQTTIMWFQPPMRRKLYFSKQLKLENNAYNLPGLIFLVHDKDLYVFAYKGKSKPTNDTVVFKAPFYNMYEDGSVCMGNTKDVMPKTELIVEIARWDRRFFNSRFDHFIDEEVIKKGTNLQLTLKSACNKLFDESLLIPSKYKNLKTLIQKVIK